MSELSVPQLLIVFGLFLIGIGIFWHFGGKYFHFGNLPGDIKIEKENFKLYFPLGTSITISIILTLLFWFFTFWRR